jgi:hypothetical protein
MPHTPDVQRYDIVRSLWRAHENRDFDVGQTVFDPLELCGLPAFGSARQKHDSNDSGAAKNAKAARDGHCRREGSLGIAELVSKPGDHYVPLSRAFESDRAAPLDAGSTDAGRQRGVITSERS